MNDKIDYVLDFPAPPRKAGFKLVKRVTMTKHHLGLKWGDPANKQVPVYMSAAGTPVFGVPVPDDLVVYWKASGGSHGVKLKNPFQREKVHFALDLPVVTSPTFDGAVEAFTIVLEEYLEMRRNASITKHIGIAMALNVPGVQHDAPHFNESTHLVGMRAEIVWRVNGDNYRDTGYSPMPRWKDDSRPVDLRPRRERDEGVPEFGDLVGSRLTYGVILPYTDEAWAALEGVKRTLETAAKALHSLTDEETAQLALAGGTFLALGGHKA